ncbi:glycoside hydrolase [Infundibulicybe gibba]|nr:glycoside hydrolase [Infundibulicybe gibba]
MSQASQATQLKGWFWKQRSNIIQSVTDEADLSLHENITQGWSTALTQPSEIHVELLKTGRIQDPYIGFNEHQVQWIGDVEWLYKCTFQMDTSPSGQYHLLDFEGLDTVCDVYLNKTKILSADNMFRMYSVPVSSLQAENTLLLHFKSAKALAKAEEAKYGQVRAGSTNLGDPSRVYVRKAQYDWRLLIFEQGPELMTCGPYRPIILRTYAARIKNIHTRPLLTRTTSSAPFSPSLKLDVTIDGSVDAIRRLHLIVILAFDGGIVRREEVPLSPKLTTEGNEKGLSASCVLRDIVNWDFPASVIEIWWPVGYGKQPLYTVGVRLVDRDANLVDELSHRIGFRDVQLIQEPLSQPDEYGTGSTFLFQVNGVRIFIGGSNWIPADNFLTTMTPARYRDWLTLLRDGNQNMVRLWGGGIYEPDVFYDICDELGILVWQDFQFACGMYPAHDVFVKSVRAEAEDNVIRLRHHASLALFCGNNEDYQQVLQWGGIDALPARKIYEDVLPSVVSKLTDPPIPYHRGSPYGGEGWDTSDPTIGDVHQWNVWGGKELPYQEYYRLGGRFVSEFGMPALPSMKTITYWMGSAQQSQWHAQSALMAQHTRAGSAERRFAIAMNENFRFTEDLEKYIMQSDAVGFAYQIWRRKWCGKGREYTSGVLVWQLNDCWPGTSWSIADYFLRPKPVYYAIARHLAPCSVGMFRTVHKNRPNDRPQQFYEFGATRSESATLAVWCTTTSLTPIPAVLYLGFFDLYSEWTHNIVTRSVKLQPNQTTEVLEIICPGPPLPDNAIGAVSPSHSVVVSAQLVHEITGEVLVRCADWPQPYRYLDVPDPKATIKVEGERIVVNVEKPAKCVFLSVDDGGDVWWSDNGLDVFPGDGQVVIAKGISGRKLKVACLGREEAYYV